MEIGSLLVKIGADLGGLEREVRRAEAVVSGLAGAVAGSAAGFERAAVSAERYADSADHTARALSGLAGAFRAAPAGAEASRAAVATLTETLERAAVALRNVDAGEARRELGALSAAAVGPVGELTRLAQQMAATAAAAGATGPGTREAAAAQRALADAAREARTAIAQAAGGLREAPDAARQTSAAMAAVATSVREAATALERLSASDAGASGIGRDLAALGAAGQQAAAGIDRAADEQTRLAAAASASASGLERATGAERALANAANDVAGGGARVADALRAALASALGAAAGLEAAATAARGADTALGALDTGAAARGLQTTAQGAIRVAAGSDAARAALARLATAGASAGTMGAGLEATARGAERLAATADRTRRGLAEVVAELQAALGPARAAAASLDDVARASRLAGEAFRGANTDAARREYAALENELRGVDARLRRAAVATDQAGRQARETAGAVRTMGGAFGDFRGTLGGFAASIAGIVSIGAAFRGIAGAVREAETAEVGLARLRQALSNLGDGGPEAVRRIEAVAAALQETTDATDDEVRAAASVLASFRAIGGSRGIAYLLPRLADLKAGSASAEESLTDLSGAAIQIGRALENGAAGLRRYGVSLTEAEEAALGAASGFERVQLLAAVLDRNFAGAAEASSRPITRLRNSIGELAEVMGARLSAAIGPVVADLTRFAQSDEAAAMAARLGDKLGELARALVEVAREVPATVSAIAGLGRELDAVGSSVFGLSDDFATSSLRNIVRDLGAIARRTAEEFRFLRQNLSFDFTRVLNPRTNTSFQPLAAFDGLGAVLRQTARPLAAFTPAFIGAARAVEGAERPVQDAAEAVGAVADAAGAAAPKVRTLADVVADLRKTLATVRAEGVLSLSGPLEEAEAHARALEAAVSDALNVNGGVVSPAIRGIAAEAVAARENVDRLTLALRFQGLNQSVSDRVITPLEAARGAADALREAYTRAMTATGFVPTEETNKLAAALGKVTEEVRQIERFALLVDAHLRQMAARFGQVRVDLSDIREVQTPDAPDLDELTRLGRVAQVVYDGLSLAVDGAAEAVGNLGADLLGALAGVNSLADAFRAFGRNAVGALQDLVAELLTAIAKMAILKGLAALFSGATGGVGGFLGSVFSALAGGNVVTAPVVNVAVTAPPPDLTALLAPLTGMARALDAGLRLQTLAAPTLTLDSPLVAVYVNGTRQTGPTTRTLLGATVKSETPVATEVAIVRRGLALEKERGLGGAL